MPRRSGLPPYRLHRASGQAVVHVGGKDVYLGLHGSEESKQRYEDIVSKYRADQARLDVERRVRKSADLTVAELILAFLSHAKTYYVKNGKSTSEYGNLCSALKPLRERYADKLASAFSPVHLKAIREQWIADGVVRSQVNKRADRVRRMFSWGVAEGLVDQHVLAALRELKGLGKGRSQAKEGRKIKPVLDAIVQATLPHMPTRVRAMCELILLSGMRPGEVCAMRPIDIDRSEGVWFYTPSSHKTEHREHERIVPLGPKAQGILKAWWKDNPDDYLFSPADAAREDAVRRRANRKTPLWPSHVAQQSNKRTTTPRKSPGKRYDVSSFRRAIKNACDRAFPHPELSNIPPKELNLEQKAELAAWRKSHRWHPHQLRHTAATRIRKEFDLDVARAVLGHTSPAVTAIYAEIDLGKARDAMARIG